MQQHRAVPRRDYDTYILRGGDNQHGEAGIVDITNVTTPGLMMTILELIPTEPQYLKKTVSRSDKILGCFQGWYGCPVDGDCIVMTMRRGQLWPCPLTIPSNMVSRLCTNLAIYVDSKLAPDFIHWYPEVPWNKKCYWYPLNKNRWQ